MEARQGAYSELQERSRAAEQAVQAAQQHYQAVTAGLSSGADGQEETLAAQKIGEEGLGGREAVNVICVALFEKRLHVEVVTHFAFSLAACESEISAAVTEIKQAEMRFV